MRYPAAEKLEIIRLIEQSPLPVRHTGSVREVLQKPLRRMVMVCG